MDIYKRKSTWKIALAIAGLIILIITMIYSNYLANSLAIVERNNVELFIEAIKDVTSDDKGDASLGLSLLERLNNIPIIIEDEDGTMEGWNFKGDDLEQDQVFLAKERDKSIKKGYVIEGSSGYSNKFYYQNSRLYSMITFFPLVQILLLSSFILLGYFGFNASRRGEQNRVWAGMAKETAHQLGTPISAILAWIEILKDRLSNEPEDLEIISELTKDVERLELVADRFSKIGSEPKLEPTNIFEEMNKVVDYMQRRAPRKVSFDKPDKDNAYVVNMNKHLFDWVIENLMRNSLDSMNGEGKISTIIYKEDGYVNIDISDTGIGIPSNKFKTVFQPGFSTKKRGWGLGLSLAKRIIENYHKGKIFVKKSKMNEGTTFTIRLPEA
jgi:two-component sensor histidine kinase